MRRFLIALSVLGCVCIAAGQSADTAVRLAVEGHANAFPWIAAAGDDVAVAWGATSNGKADVYVAVSRDGGRTFSTPARVNDHQGAARLGGDGSSAYPVLAATARGAIAAVTRNTGAHSAVYDEPVKE